MRRSASLFLFRCSALLKTRPNSQIRDTTSWLEEVAYILPLYIFSIELV